MMLFKYLFFSTTLLLSFVLHTDAQGCEVDPILARAPLIIRPGNTTIIYPKYGETVIAFGTGETVEFACPQREVLLEGTPTAAAVVEATCVSGARFRVNGARFLWRQITCKNNPIATGKLLNSNCGIGGRLAEIGFQLNNNRFLRTITICFDTVNQTPMYSYYELPASIASRDSSTPRPQFWQDNGFYSIGSRTVNQLYTRANQRATINGLLGLPAKDLKYIDNGNLLFLSRGHLTARSDFIYGALQNATFKYINAAPQWQSSNGQNWNQAEIDTRNYANLRKANLQVWTGTYGVATLPHENTQKEVPLYLYVDGNNRGLPVPALYWKMVYEPISREAIVLIGLNNPYENDVFKHVLCPDISSSVKWLTWNQHDIRQGYSYACTVASFRKAVPYVPNLSVSDCLIDIKTLQEKHPLFLDIANNDLIYPQPGTSTIVFKTKENFNLDCPGGLVVADGLTFNRTVTATCVSDEIVRIESQNINVTSIVCSKKIASVARFTSNICWKKYREIEVGFELPNNKFFHLYSSCFDDISRNVIYSTFELGKEIGYQTTGNSRPGWTEGIFYNLTDKLDDLYKNALQMQTINRQVGLPDNDTTFIKSTGNYYLAKGHLTAKVDFLYNAEQQATFFYINAVPQWETFNGLNWFYLERNLRNYSAQYYVDLTVYTGTYGILTLPHAKTGEDVELYLFQDEMSAIPIPELFWKIAYDPINKAGVVVLGINNPYQTDIPKSIICNDISSEISWLNFDTKNPASGYLYACTVDDLRKVIPNIPNLNIKKLLT